MLSPDAASSSSKRKPPAATDPSPRNPYLQHLVDMESGTPSASNQSLMRGMERIETQKREALSTYLRLAAMRLGLVAPPLTASLHTEPTKTKPRVGHEAC